MNLPEIQETLKAPKGQTNDFGKYKYRSCEDIVEALKPIIHPAGISLILSDEMVDIGGRVYVKATASLKGEGLDVFSVGWAREALTKKGMDEAQITGSASSYARKYALNGLLAIDDTKDADTMDNRKEPKKEEPTPLVSKEQIENIEALAKEVKADMNEFLRYLGVHSLPELFLSNYDYAITSLEKKRCSS